MFLTIFSMYQIFFEMHVFSPNPNFFLTNTQNIEKWLITFLATSTPKNHHKWRTRCIFLNLLSVEYAIKSTFI